jgi:multidrug efflux pump
MKSQRAVGSGLLGGMVTATVLAIFVTPLFCVLIAKTFGPRKRDGAAHCTYIADH